MELPGEGLSESIPAQLGGLFGLTHLDLSNNSLTGEIPEELDRLENLEEIRLSGNSLTGCIPLSLKDVATNDLSSLNLLYCPPTPGNLSSGMVGEASIALSWNAVSSTSKYRVEYWDPAAGSWVVADDTLTGTSHAVDGLTCEREYRFRVSAYGSGTTYAAEWSEWSASLTASTAACAPPVFVSTPEPSYLTEEILPCTPISGTSVDPCEPGVVPMVSGSGAGIFALGSEPWGLRWFMDPAGGGSRDPPRVTRYLHPRHGALRQQRRIFPLASVKREGVTGFTENQSSAMRMCAWVLTSSAPARPP